MNRLEAVKKPLYCPISSIPFCPKDSRPELTEIANSITETTTTEEFIKATSKIPNLNLASRVTLTAKPLSYNAEKLIITRSTFLELALKKFNYPLAKYLITHIKRPFLDYRMNFDANAIFRVVNIYCGAKARQDAKEYYSSEEVVQKQITDLLKLAKLLLSKGVEVNYCSYFYSNLGIALGCSGFKPDKTIAELLVDYGARKLAVVGKDGFSVLESQFSEEGEKIYQLALDRFQNRIILIILGIKFDKGTSLRSLTYDCIFTISKLYLENKYEQKVNQAKEKCIAIMAKKILIEAKASDLTTD